MSTTAGSARGPQELSSPAVSVIIATYLADVYLRSAIASALAQTFPSLEVIVSDDAGRPEVRRLVQEFGDARLVYRANARRLGPAGNHWAAFRAARGRYLAILNHDDLWEPEFLASLVSPLEAHPTAVVAFCDVFIINERGERLGRETDESSRFTGRDRLAAGLHAPFQDLLAGGTIATAQGAVFRRGALDLRDLLCDAGPAYDLWLHYLLARTGRAAYYCPRRLSSWRRHASSLSALWDDDWSTGSARCWHRIAADPLFADYRDFARAREALCYSVASVTCLRQGRRADAWRNARHALSVSWRRPKPWAVLALSLLPFALACRLLPRR
jgi:glycosyltransferase involved in cell wall biosynthesis